MRMMGEDWVRLSVPNVLWLNTAVLILASVAMQWTRGAARREQLDQVKTGMIAAGAFSFAFLAGQLWAWQQMVAAGYFHGGQPRILVLLSSDRRTRDTSSRRPVGVGPDDPTGDASRRRTRPDTLERRVVHRDWHYLLVSG